MPPNTRSGGVIRLHDLTEYTGTFSWNPDILRMNIELDILGYSSYDPATWPRISKDTIRRSTGLPYDGSTSLPGGVAAFDEDVMSLFLGKIAKSWSFKAAVSAQNQSSPNSTICWGFRDFPFVFDQDGRAKKRNRRRNLPLTVRDTYVRLLGPCQSASMNDSRPSLGVQPGPSRPRSLSQEPHVKEEEHEDIDQGPRKPSEEAYRELIGMLQDQHTDIEEAQQTKSMVAQDVSRTDEAESVSNAAFIQCESAVNQLTELARLEFYALRTELDEKVKGFDDKMRKLEQRAIAAEEKSSELEKHLESKQQVVSNLNARIDVANEKVLSACNNARAAESERKASERRVAALERQLSFQESELTALKKKSNQAGERLMTLWDTLEKSMSSTSGKRREVGEPPGSMEADAMRDTKRARKDKQASFQPDHEDDGNFGVDAPIVDH